MTDELKRQAHEVLRLHARVVAGDTSPESALLYVEAVTTLVEMILVPKVP